MGNLNIPRVSIGLAVYNGEKYLKEAIDSLLSQTFTDFELIISDNASTDQTETIAISYAQQDARIRYSRNATNIGGANNENRTFELARGEYFRWAAHDDVCAPDMLEKLVQVLDRDPHTVLAYSNILKIDENSKAFGILESRYAYQTTPSERFRDLTSSVQGCETIYGLIRTATLRKSLLQLNYTDSDRSLLSELSLYGRFTKLDDVLFYKRYHPHMSIQVFKDWRQRMAWFGPVNEGKITMPHWMQLLHLIRIVHRSDIHWLEKLRCYGHLVVWVFQYRRWRSLIKDALLAFIQSGRNLFRPNKMKNPLENI